MKKTVTMFHPEWGWVDPKYGMEYTVDGRNHLKKISQSCEFRIGEKTPPKDIFLKKNTNILPTRWTLTNYE